MSGFANVTEKRAFISDTGNLFNNIIQPCIPAEYKDYVNRMIDEYRNKHIKLFTIAPEKDFVTYNESERCRISEMYVELKDSLVIHNIEDLDLNTINLSNAQECITAIRSLKIQENYKNSRIRLNQFYIGSALFEMKKFTRSKEVFGKLVKEVGYSISYAYKLIKFYNICCQFRNIKLTSFPLIKLIDNYDYLLEYIEKDNYIWIGSAPPSPSNNVATP